MGTAFAVLNILIGLVIARIAERTHRVALIAIGTLFWSIATALCGMVANWTQLLVARVGVGVGEAIGIPGNQSVVADYFPPQRRGLAMSILLLAPPVGAFIGFVGGGWIAQNFDWRWTFLIAAIPGLVLGVLVYFFIAEPPRGQHDVGATDEVPGMGAVMRRFLKLPSARHLVIGSTIAAAIGFGLNYFFTSLMIRRFGLSIGEASLYAGLIASLPAAISVVGMELAGRPMGSEEPRAPTR